MTNRFFAGQTDYIEQLNAIDVLGSAGAHIADTTGAHAATAISNTPAGNIAATTVQGALNELDSEKANLTGATFTGDVTVQGALSAKLASASNTTFRGLAWGVTGDGNDYGGVKFKPDTGEVRATAGFATWGGFHTWYGNGSKWWEMSTSGHFLPGTDNTYNVGSGAYRVGTYYGATGSINTSDARLKTPLRPLTPAELAAGLEIAKLGPGVFQFLDAVAEKGADRARLHVGYTVQAVMAIMTSHGLDPARYAFICHDSWGAEVVHHPAVQASAAVPEQPAVYEERMVDVLIRVNGEDRAAQRPVLVEVQPAVPAQPAVEAREAWTETLREAGDRYSFRPDQLDRFINAAVIQAAIERLGL